MKEKILRGISVVLLIIYGIIFLFMLVNRMLMGAADSGMSAVVQQVTNQAIAYGLLHSAINVGYTILVLCALKRRRYIPFTIVIGCIISVLMRFLPLWLLGNVSYVSVPLLCRIVSMVLLFLIYRETKIC